MVFLSFFWSLLELYWGLFIALWPLSGLYVAPLIFPFIKRGVRWYRLKRAGMYEIDRMNGRDFEHKLAILFRQKGYRVKTTPYVGDWGADLVVSKDGRRIVIQAKRWNRRVNPKAVQEVVGSKPMYGCQDAMVVTNSFFTQAARKLARVHGVELWDRSRLARELLALEKGRGRDKQAVAPQSDAAPSGTPSPSCSKCGREMVMKEKNGSRFWACPGFPGCRNTLPVRAAEGAGAGARSPA